MVNKRTGHNRIMANETSGRKSQEQPPTKVAVQSQLARIKKEEEEELWISGEELYTEGSSDEEECKTQSRWRRKVNSDRSSPTVSANGRGASPASTEIKTRPQHSKDELGDRNTTLKNTPTFHDPSSSEILDPALTDSQKIRRPLTAGSCIATVTKVSTDEYQMENKEISWKVKRELSCNDENMMENECEVDIDISSIDTADECMRKEILQVKNLDNLIRAMDDKVKKASEETLFCQCENRKRLEQILTLAPSETGKLAENTRQFFYLCPGYTTLDAGDEAYVSLGTNDSEQEIFQCGKDNVNNDATYVEDPSNKIWDTNSNPYAVNKKLAEMLLALEGKENEETKQERFEEYESLSNTSLLSLIDSIPTAKSSQDIDDYLNEAGQEASEASIVDFAKG